MAEAIAAVGLAASILQIVSTGVQASVYLYNLAETVSSTGRTLKEIADDISFTTSVLEQLKAILESERDYGTATKEALTTADRLVRECSTVFEKIMALLKKHFPVPEFGGKKVAKLTYLRYPFLLPKIEVMRSNLEKHKTELILMVQVLTYAKIVASEQRNLEGQLEQERQKLEAFVIVSHRLKAKSKCIINPLGLTEVFNPPAAACVDVVFVHGISGHPKDTWTCAEEDVFWPAELLPPVLEDEDTRVLTYGYEAGAEVFTDGESEHQIHEVIRSLGRDLASNRQVRKASTRPLVWVAHSLGGLIVKGVLAHSSKSPETAIPDLRPISTSTYGVIFLSTPHTILPLQIDLLCEAALCKGAGETIRTIKKLRAKYTALQTLNQEFLGLAHQYQLHCFREMLEPKILDDISARLSELHPEATGIRADHYSISKFGSDNSPGFDLVCAVIQHYVSRAAVSISSCRTGHSMEGHSNSFQQIHSATEPRATEDVSSFLEWPRNNGQEIGYLQPLMMQQVYPEHSLNVTAQPRSGPTLPRIGTDSYDIGFESYPCPRSDVSDYGTSSRSSTVPSNISLTNKQNTPAALVTYMHPYVCDELGCENDPGFPSFDGLLRHQREVHKRRDSFQARTGTHNEPSKPVPRSVWTAVAGLDSAATDEEAPAMKKTKTAPQAEEGLTKLHNEHRDSPRKYSGRYHSFHSHHSRRNPYARSPQYPAPQCPAPQRAAPQCPAPQYPAPQYPAPQYLSAQYSAPQYPATDNVALLPMNAEGDFGQSKSHSFSKDDSSNPDMVVVEQLCMDLPEETGPQVDLSRESLYMPNLNATDEERDRAKEEVIKLLRQWTTLDGSGLDDETDPGLAAAPEVDATGRVGLVHC